MALRALARTPQEVAKLAAQQHRGKSVLDLAQAPIGGVESKQQKARRAALLALKERQQHPSMTGASAAQRLADEVKLEQAEDAYAYGAGAAGLEQQWQRATRTPQSNELAGFARPQLHTPGEMTRLGAGMTMANNAALTGGAFAPKGFEPEERPLDPRLSVQGRNEFERIGAERAGKHDKLVSQAMSAADTEARNIREQQRMQIEGDAWVAEQRRKSQALTALAGR